MSFESFLFSCLSQTVSTYFVSVEILLVINIKIHRNECVRGAMIIQTERETHPL